MFTEKDFIVSLMKDIMLNKDHYEAKLVYNEKLVIKRSRYVKYAGYEGGSCIEVFHVDIQGNCSCTEIFSNDYNGFNMAIICFVNRLFSNKPSKDSGTGMSYEDVFTRQR